MNSEEFQNEEDQVDESQANDPVAVVGTAMEVGPGVELQADNPIAPDELEEPVQVESAALAKDLLSLHPARKQHLMAEIDGIVRQGGMSVDTVLHLVGIAIQRELDA